MVLIWNPSLPPWQPSWKSIFRFFSWTERPTDLKLVESTWVTCISKIAQNHSDRKSKMATIWNIIFRFYSWRKHHLTWNLIGSIRVTHRSKIAKIILLEIQDGRHSENLFCLLSLEPKGQLTLNLVGNVGATCRSEIAKIVPIGNPRWLPWWPAWKSIFPYISWTKKANWLESW